MRFNLQKNNISSVKKNINSKAWMVDLFLCYTVLVLKMIIPYTGMIVIWDFLTFCNDFLILTTHIQVLPPVFTTFFRRFSLSDTYFTIAQCIFMLSVKIKLLKLIKIPTFEILWIVSH